MKILLVNKFLYPNGGSETYIFELGRQLDKMGHEVQYFGMEHPDRIVGNSAGAYTSNMDFHGGNKLAKLTAPFKIIYSFEARRQIRKVLEDFNPDVVHLNNINFQLTPSIIYEIRKWEKAGMSKLPSHSVRIVFTAHDYQWICPNHMLYIPQNCEVCERCQSGGYIQCAKNNCIHGSKLRSILGSIEGYYYKWRRTYDKVDSIICPSQFLFDKFSKDSILKDKLVMLHNFVMKDNKEKEAVNTDNSKYVLYFGRFDAQKGIRTLIEACRLLPDIRFVFAGKGPLEEELNGVANIENVGFKSGDELKNLIAGAAFSVYPSEWYENCPFSVMESQMYGTPVIGADIGGIPELIITGDENRATGVLFEAGNAESLTDKIRKLWNDDKRIERYSDNCDRITFDNLEEYTEKMIRLYK